MKTMPLHHRHTARFVVFCLLAILAVMGRPAHADYHPPYTFLDPLGGPGGGDFEQMCPFDQNLIGFELRTGDDVDAIRPICALAYAPNMGGGYQRVPWGDPSWHGGPGGGQQNLVVCPPETPAILGITIYAEGQDTVIVNTISLFCGLASATVQLLPETPSAVFDAPHYSL